MNTGVVRYSSACALGGSPPLLDSRSLEVDRLTFARYLRTSKRTAGGRSGELSELPLNHAARIRTRVRGLRSWLPACAGSEGGKTLCGY